MLTIKHLNVSFDEKQALNIQTPITFNTGERIGIIGSNGAGKSTLVKSILGLINYHGEIITELKPHQMTAHMQENEYVDTMSTLHVIEAILNTKLKSNQKLQEIIDFFDFKECLNKKYKVLSGGQKQRFTIILVLMQDAPLVFFDEVTSGLDFETRELLMSKINSWYENKSTTVVIVSHYYTELEQLVNKLLILDQGEVVDFGSTDELFKKYCSYCVIILDNNQQNSELTKCMSKVDAPNHLIALSCQNNAEEMVIIEQLSKQNISFKRSNSDIEIMSINAKNKKIGVMKNEN